MSPPPKASTTTTTAAPTDVNARNATDNATTTTTVVRTGAHSGTGWEVTSPPLSLLRSNGTATLYRSPVTDLRALLIRTDEPLCTLHIVLATEAITTDWCHKDDGLPHTLEHAVFLGSELYPYKGILDKLANRSLADGTNAWTATDHTAYTLTTAGDEGVLNLLPIFADHVLYPTLAEEGFVTEVHHVTSEGKDKGVVYCEMQGRENTDGSLVDRAILDLLYPAETCGYSSETGGKMRNLRSLSVDQVRRYHRENYTPDNVIFVLSGNVGGGEDEQRDDDIFLNAMDQVERRVREKQRGEGGDGTSSAAPTTSRDDGGGRPGGRPWHRAAVPPMDTSKVGVMPPMGTRGLNDGDVDGNDTTEEPKLNPKPLEITFPSEDESRGTVSVGWRGPTYQQRREWMHLRMMWRYLTESAASPLQKSFVECDDPLCAHVAPAHEVFTEGYHQLWFNEVETGRMDEVVPRLTGALRSAYHDFDIGRMGLVVRRYRRKLLESAERRPTDSLIDGVVRNFLYAPRYHGADLSREMDDLSSDADELALLEEAEKLDARSWLDVMDTYVLSRPYALVVGRPSARLAVDMAEEERAREEKQAKDLGETRLRELGEELERAIEHNERDIPAETLTSVPIPSLERVKPVPLLTIRGVGSSSDPSLLAVAPNSGRGVDPAIAALVLGNLRSSAVASSGDASPYYVDWNHIDSAFLTVAVGMDTVSLTTRQRLYLPLLLEIAFKLPATLDDGSVLSKDEFVSRLQDDTVSYGADVGLLGSTAPQMVSVSVQVENRDDSGLDLALTWIRRVLYLTTITEEAVTVAVQRLASEIPPQIRDGPTVLRAVGDELNYDPARANVVSCSPIRQRPFLTELSRMIGGDVDVELSSEGATGGGGGGAEDIVRELNDLRAELVQSKRLQLFVAGNLMDVTDSMQKLARSLLPPDGRGLAPPPLTRDGPATIGRFIENVSASSVLCAKSDDDPSSSTGRAAVCALSAIESGFLAVTAPGVGAYHPDHASLLVAIEYLTALEGDFWIKIRGAGLSYGASIRNSTDSELLRFGLYKCTDVAGAFEAAAGIIVDYASGKVEMSRVELENAKSSLAYGIIAGVSTKLGAATDAWVGHYQGKGVDYDRWLLSKISEVTEEDAMHALVKFLVPIFDAGSGNVVVTCPTNKMDELCEYFTTRGWTSVKRVPEERICSAFADQDSAAGGETEEAPSDTSAEFPDKVAGVSMFMPGAFAAQFRCGCPKCGREEAE